MSSKTWLTCTLLLGSLGSGAALGQAPGLPAYPLPVSPYQVVVEAQWNNATTTFVWNQYQIIGTPTRPLPVYFAVCLRRSGQGTCTWQSALWQPTAASVPSELIRDFNRIVGRRYTFVTPTLIPNDRLDTSVNWQVGACAAPNTASCSFSGSVAFRLSTKDLWAHNISANLLGTTYDIAALVTNRGTTDSGPFETSVEWWEALYDPMTAKCRNNPNDQDLRNDPNLYAFFGSSPPRHISQLPRDSQGNYVTTDIVGLYRAGSAASWRRTSSGGLPVGAQQRAVAGISLQVPVAGRPRAFIGSMTVDTQGAVHEFSESNNYWAECEAVF